MSTTPTHPNLERPIIYSRGGTACEIGVVRSCADGYRAVYRSANGPYITPAMRTALEAERHVQRLHACVALKRGAERTKG